MKTPIPIAATRGPDAAGGAPAGLNCNGGGQFIPVAVTQHGAVIATANAADDVSCGCKLRPAAPIVVEL
jgi:hypothetical protein